MHNVNCIDEQARNAKQALKTVLKERLKSSEAVEKESRRQSISSVSSLNTEEVQDDTEEIMDTDDTDSKTEDNDENVGNLL